MSIVTARSLKVSAIVVAILMIVCLAAGLVFRAVGARAEHRARHDFEAAWGSLDPASLAPAAVAEPANAARWIRAGAAAAVMTENEKGAVARVSERPVSSWGAEDRALVEAALARSAGALATAATAVPLTQSAWGVPYEDGWEAELPKLLEVLGLARLAAVDARLARARGDHQRVVDDLHLLARVAGSLEGESVLIVGLVGLAVERLQLVLGAELAADPAVPVESLAAAAQTLLTTDLVADGRRWIRFEVASMADGIHAASGDGAGGGIEAVATRIFAGHVNAAAIASFATALACFEEPTARGCGASEEPSWWNLPARYVDAITPDLASTVARAQSVLALRQRLAAAFELRRGAATAGVYPGEASAILGGPEPLSGQPVRYTVNGDGSATLELVEGPALLGRFAVPSAVKSMEPLVLPPPASPTVG